MSTQQEMRARPLLWIGIIFLFFLIAVFLRVGNFIEFSEETLQRLGFLKSPAFRLAEYTARSDFTEKLTRMAWRRMYWGRLAARRVLDEAPLADIDTAWSAYINASADWNAEVMIFIVGLERYYDAERRGYFEGKLLPLLVEFDEALGRVRRSQTMRKLRSSQIADAADQAEIKRLHGEVASLYDALNLAMYDFARIEKRERR